MNKVKTQGIGQSLKERREELNISLKEAENATSIRLNYLMAIEESDVQKVISPVYAQGFIKQYASFLGMDGEKLVREHPDAFQKTQVAQEFSYGIGTLEMRDKPGSGVKALPNTLYIAAFFAVLGVAWWVAKFFEVL